MNYKTFVKNEENSVLSFFIGKFFFTNTVVRFALMFVGQLV